MRELILASLLAPLIGVGMVNAGDPIKSTINTEWATTQKKWMGFVAYGLTASYKNIFTFDLNTACRVSSAGRNQAKLFENGDDSNEEVVEPSPGLSFRWCLW